MHLVLGSLYLLFLTFASIPKASGQHCPQFSLRAKVHPKSKRGILAGKRNVKVSVKLRSINPVADVEVKLTLPDGLTLKRTATRPSSKPHKRPEIVKNFDMTTAIHWRGVNLTKHRK
jgi:hypothetical protein